MTWNARWFNGRDSTAHAAVANLLGDELQVQLTSESVVESMSFPISAVIVSERFLATARRLQMPDRSTLVVDDDADGSFDLALHGRGHQDGLASRLMRGWRGSMACLLVLFALLIWIDRQGAGLLASLAVPIVPTSVDAQLGATVGTLLEQNWLAESEIPEARQQRLSARVKQITEAQYPNLAWSLYFRNVRDGNDAFNAFALPGGSIVLLDELTVELTDDQVVAVIAHELGHVVHRHSMQGLLRQMGLLATAGVMLGDVSVLAAGVTAGYQDLHYSRDAEREADVFAIDFLRRSRVPVRHIAEAFKVIQAREAEGGVLGFLSSHPPTEERLRLAQEAASQ